MTNHRESFEQRRARRAAYAWVARAITASANMPPERPRVNCECGESDGHAGPHSAAACYRVTRGGRTLNVCGNCTLYGDSERVWLDDEWANRPVTVGDVELAAEVERIRAALEAAGAVEDGSPESTATGLGGDMAHDGGKIDP